MVKVLALPAYRNRRTNPYNALLYSHMPEGTTVREFRPLAALLESYDVLHIHWPDAYVNDRSFLKSLIYFFALIGIIAVARAKRVRIVWTVHNLQGHEGRNPGLERALKAYLLRHLNTAIHLSEPARQAALATHPQLGRIRNIVIPHGHYLDVYPNRSTRRSARVELGIPEAAQVLGVIGMIRSYKNVDAVAALVMDSAELHLLVAGRVGDAASVEILQRIRTHPRIHVYDHFIEDEDLHLYVNACDAVVFPYRDILNSGSALMALGFGAQVLAPHVGSLEELGHMFPGWVTLYDGPLLARHLDEVLTSSREASGPIDLGALNWTRLARMTAEAYVDSGEALRSGP